jgi:hypothetical protein
MGVGIWSLTTLLQCRRVIAVHSGVGLVSHCSTIICSQQRILPLLHTLLPALFTRIIATIMNDASEVLSEASSPLSTALDTSVLGASNQAVENPTSFTIESDSSQYVE